mmetsp:Transcript_101115/g.184554  ORF Transcript_101115/g.184554 Transcript_101115/m.184554 type:complete len:479 (+) Transcript_101115:106-1542(+)
MKLTTTRPPCIAYFVLVFSGAHRTWAARIGSEAKEEQAVSAHEPNAKRQGVGAPVLRVAVVGGGPSGLAFVLSLMNLWREDSGALEIDIYEKRFDLASHGQGRHQRVYMPWNKLEAAVAENTDHACKRCKAIDPEDLQRSLSIEMGESAPTVSIGTLENSLLRLLSNKLHEDSATSESARIRFHWYRETFTEQHVRQYHHVVGCDGKRSFIRTQIMQGWLTQNQSSIADNERAVLMTYHYDHKLQWDNDQYLLKLRSPEPKPIIAYFDIDNVKTLPEYLDVTSATYQAVKDRFVDFARDKNAPNPWTEPWENLAEFEANFEGEVLADLRKGFEEEDVDPSHRAVIVPVMCEVHRSLNLTLPKEGVESRGIAGVQLWLLGDAAIGLSISTGCNIVYHIASAQKLAEVIVDGLNPQDYEDFVIKNWETETWRTTKSKQASANIRDDCMLDKCPSGVLEHMKSEWEARVQQFKREGRFRQI